MKMFVEIWEGVCSECGAKHTAVMTASGKSDTTLRLRCDCKYVIVYMACKSVEEFPR